jgi:hypothetical protein
MNTNGARIIIANPIKKAQIKMSARIFCGLSFNGLGLELI